MSPAAQQKCPIENRKRQVNFWRCSHFIQQLHKTLKTQLRNLRQLNKGHHTHFDSKTSYMRELGLYAGVTCK